VYFQAIWLRSDTPGGDLIYTAAGDEKSLYEHGKLYTAKEFLAKVRPVVRGMLSLPSAPLHWTNDDQMHTYFLNRFVLEPGRGMSRMAGPSLQPDELMQLDLSEPTSEANQKTDSKQSYRLKSVELIGLANHNPPVLFVQAYHPPDMGGMRLIHVPDTYRLLTESEQKMLTDLATNKKDSVAQMNQGERVVLGAIRAQESCSDVIPPQN
jgi:hypothetical protein